MELFELGPAAHGWTRYLRVLINFIRRFFLTATVLLLVLLGSALLMRAGRWR